MISTADATPVELPVERTPPAGAAADQAPPRPHAARERDVKRARTLSRWLDQYYLDPLIGLVAPGVGDLVSSAAGLWIIGLAMKHRLPSVIIARMMVYQAVDAALGAVPVLGDLFDLGHRAHQKNARLLAARHHRSRASFGDWLVVGAAALFLVAALALPIIVLGVLLGAAGRAIPGV